MFQGRQAPSCLRQQCPAGIVLSTIGLQVRSYIDDVRPKTPPKTQDQHWRFTSPRNARRTTASSCALGPKSLPYATGSAFTVQRILPKLTTASVVASLRQQQVRGAHDNQLRQCQGHRSRLTVHLRTFMVLHGRHEIRSWCWSVGVAAPADHFSFHNNWARPVLSDSKLSCQAAALVSAFGTCLSRLASFHMCRMRTFASCLLWLRRASRGVLPSFLRRAR